jgi:hypothetical protein
MLLLFLFYRQPSFLSLKWKIFKFVYDFHNKHFELSPNLFDSESAPDRVQTKVGTSNFFVSNSKFLISLPIRSSNQKLRERQRTYQSWHLRLKSHFPFSIGFLGTKLTTIDIVHKEEQKVNDNNQTSIQKMGNWGRFNFTHFSMDCNRHIILK